MKALIGLAGVAIAVLTAGGIKAALPRASTGPDPSEGKATQVRVTGVVDGDTLRVERTSAAASSAESACSASTPPKSPTLSLIHI